MKNHLYFIIPLITFFGWLLTECQPASDELLERENAELNDSTLALGSAKFLRVREGIGRVELSWTYSDKRVEKYKVTWDEGKGVKEGVLDGHLDEEFRILLTQIEEGQHTFVVTLSDEEGRESFESVVKAKVYGKTFTPQIEELIPEEVSFNFVFGIDFKPIEGPNKPVAIIVEYENASKEMKVDTFKYSSSIRINNVYHQANEESLVKYKGAYLLGENALDMYFTEFEEVGAVFDNMLDRDLAVVVDKESWKWAYLDGDVIPRSADVENNAWDGRLDNQPFMGDMQDFPQSLTINLNQKVILTKFKKQDTQMEGGSPPKKYYNFYASNTPRVIEIYGSNNPSQDGSWDSWTKLGEGHFDRPESYAPPSNEGEPNLETIQAGIKGDSIELEIINPDEPVAYQYIRLKVLEDYRSPELPFYVYLGEVTLWGFSQDD